MSGSISAVGEIVGTSFDQLDWAGKRGLVADRRAPYFEVVTCVIALPISGSFQMRQIVALDMGGCGMYKTFASVACAVALLGAVSAAEAWDVSASVSVSELKFQLIDLNPNDGITPWVTFPTGLNWELSLYSFNTMSGDGYGEVHSGALESATAASAEVGTSVAVGGVRIVGTPVGGTAWLSSSANADRYGNGMGEGGISGSFLMSPFTKLVISGVVSMDGSTTAGGETAEFESGFSVRDAPQSQESHSYWSVFVRAEADEFPPQPHTTSRSQTLQVSLENMAPDAMSGDFGVQVRSHAFSNVVQQIPEPQSWAMLIAGFAVVAAVVRNRRGSVRQS